MLYGSVPGIDKRISRLVLGTVSFKPDQQDLANQLLDAFVERGGTAIDTAHGYGRGASERAVGAWLHARGARDEVMLLTKGAHYVTGENGEMIRRVNPAEITKDLLESLDRLQLESVDLYLLHRDDPSQPVGPIVEVLNEHYRAGRMRAFGGSNWSYQRIEEANAYAREHGLVGFAASSPNLALAIPKEPMWPECLTVAGDPEALAWYRRTQFPLFSWSSQASGFFSGRFTPDEGPEGTPDVHVARVYYNEANWERLRRAREVAQRHDTTPTRVALAWVLHQPLNVFALIGPRTLQELDDSLGALDVHLSPDEVAWLNLEQ